MTTKVRSLLLLTVAALCLPSVRSYAQLVSGEVFMQGSYVELGLAPNGAFGTGNPAPTGYHPRAPGPQLGFVADPKKDGWTVGTPAYCGDYFLPGDPQEGWDIQVGAVRAKAWRGSGGGPTSMTGGLTGSNTGYTATATTITGTWEGSVSGIAIRQLTTLKKDKAYFVLKVTLKNTTSSPISDIFYERTLDPDNESAMSGGAVTDNRIEFKLPNPKSKTLVSGTGTVDTVYLGLGTKDCRARPYILNSGLAPGTGDSLNKLWYGDNGSPHIFKPDTTYRNDVGIGVVFNIGTLNPGDSTILFYAYVLSTADLDSAFKDMSPVWSFDGKQYESGDTIKICRDPGAGPEWKNLDISGGDDYTWNWRARPGLKNATGTDNETYLTDATITYVAKPSEAFGCIDSMVLTIQPFTKPPAPTVISPVVYCQYATPKPLTGSTVSGGVLRFYLTETATEFTNTLTPSTSTLGSTTFWVSQINGICESPRVPIVVKINPLPTISDIQWGNPTRCGSKDGFITFKTNANATIEFNYDFNLSPAAPITVTTDASGIVTVSGLGMGSYTNLRVINEFGCASEVYFGPILLKGPVAVQPVISNGGPVCAGQTVKLNANHMDSTLYSWTGPGGFSSSEESPEFVTTEASAGVYTLITNKNGCIADPETTTLVVYALPKNPNTPDQAVCEGKELKIDVVSELNVLYMWRSDDGFTAPAAGFVRSNMAPSNAGRYIMTATSDQNCVTIDTVIVNVDEPVTLTTDGDTSICLGDAATIFAHSNSNVIEWTPAAGLDNPNSAQPLAMPSSTTTYTVKAQSDHATCPDKTGSVTVTVVPAPTVTGYDSVVRMNVPYTITPVYGSDIVKYRWTPADSLNCSDCPNPVFNSNQTTRYIVYVSNSMGCTSSDTVNISVFCNGASVTMPNAFTPNGDGHNDLYYVRGHGFVVRKFAIYNRLGQEVFAKENFMPNDTQYGWDGTFQGTKITNSDGFVYLLEVQCYNSDNEPTTLKGTFLLIR